MLNFQEFKEQTKVSIRSYLSPKYGEVDIKEHSVHKNNCTLTGVTISMEDAHGNVCPTFYLEPLYEKYKDGYEFDVVMEMLEGSLVQGMTDREVIQEQLKGFQNPEDNIFFHLIHTEQNRDLLQNLPHRDFLNLSIVYRVMVELNQNGMASALLTNDLAERLGFQEQELYDLAYTNTKELMEPVVRPMHDMVRELLERNGAEGLEQLNADVGKEILPFYIVTNRCLEKGAINVIYPEVMEPLAKKFDSDLYLLPMSMHEMLVCPKGFMGPEELAEMLHTNNPGVDIEDRLSNDIYMYDKNAQTIFQVTNHGDVSLVEEDELVGIEEDSDMEMGMC